MAAPATVATPTLSIQTELVNTPALSDKSLWVAFITPIAFLLNKKFGLTLDPAEVVTTFLPPVLYIIFNKWKTATLAKALIQGALAAVPPPPAPAAPAVPTTPAEAAAVVAEVK